MPNQFNIWSGIVLFGEIYLLGWPVFLTSLIRKKIAPMNATAYKVSSHGFLNCRVSKLKCRNKDRPRMTAIIVKVDLIFLLYKWHYVKYQFNNLSI